MKGRRLETEQKNLEEIWLKMQQLSEVQDQSRNEQMPLFLDEESIRSQAQRAFWETGSILEKSQVEESVHKKSISIRKGEEEWNRVQQKRSESSRLNIQSETVSKEKLVQMNYKLMSDNKKLFAECLRLRKQQLVAAHQQKLSGNQHNMNTDLDLRAQNKMLSDGIEILKETQFDTLKKHQSLIDSLTAQKKQIQELSLKQKDEIIGLKTKMQQMLEEKQKQQEKLNGTFSISTTTHQSKSQHQADRERVIKNMKIVHDAEVKKLNKKIAEQEEIIKRLNNTDSEMKL